MAEYLKKAQDMIAQNAHEIAVQSARISTIGCSWCGLGCSGIVGD